MSKEKQIRDYKKALVRWRKLKNNLDEWADISCYLCSAGYFQLNEDRKNCPYCPAKAECLTDRFGWFEITPRLYELSTSIERLLLCADQRIKEMRIPKQEIAP